MTIQIYVGTYAKYNSGSIAGKWIDLEPFAGDRDGFLAACKELHKGEHDPEFMFQDFEGFPREYYSESQLPDALFDWLDLNDDDRKMMAAYSEAVGLMEPSEIKTAKDAYYGKYDSESDFVEQYVDSTGMLSSLPDNVAQYFDYEKFGRNLMFDFSTHTDDGGNLWVFLNQ
jgi:antirestriction protein